MGEVPGTQGYGNSVERFIAATRDLSFHVVCKGVAGFIPDEPARVLDVGAGIGQNAAALAEMGHEVVAVEPMKPFLDHGRSRYSQLPIDWYQDSLPWLGKIATKEKPFGFILVEAVWHHLDENERQQALTRLAGILHRDGICAISLRNGPPGAGTRVFPTDAGRTVRQAETSGLDCVYCSETLPSVLPGKEQVNWTRVVLRKASM